MGDELKYALIHLFLSLGAAGFIDFKLGYMPTDDANDFLDRLNDGRRGHTHGPVIALLNNDAGKPMSISVDPEVVMIVKVTWLEEMPVKEEKTAEFSSRDDAAQGPAAVPDRKAN